MPNPQERLTIWEKSIPPNLKLAGDVQLNSIARKYEITGASIMNVVQHCCLQAVHAKSMTITEDTLLAGIKREFLKEGKVWQER
jgi:ATP-dependent 26S proteasome regulatory subunit